MPSGQYCGTLLLKYMVRCCDPVNCIITGGGSSVSCDYWPAYWASIVLLAVVCCCRLSGFVTLPAGRPGMWAVGHPTLHGGPVWLCPVRATPSYLCVSFSFYSHL